MKRIMNYKKQSHKHQNNNWQKSSHIRSSLLTLLFLMCTTLFTRAQCPLQNTAFQAGERLTYELYFNWKFVWVKAGTATFTTQKTEYKGENCFRTNLITKTSPSLDKFFCMRDTLVGITTQQNVPLYYRKGAFEGKKYRLDQVWYDYPAGKTHIIQTCRKPSGNVKRFEHTQEDCIYDMISMMQRARSFDVKQFEKNKRMSFKMADGDEIDKVFLIYRGKETVKQEGSKIKFRCLVFSFVENENGKEKEIVRFFISDDDNHMPVRLDLNLRFGTAKAYLKSYQGTRNEVNSIVK